MDKDTVLDQLVEEGVVGGFKQITDVNVLYYLLKKYEGDQDFLSDLIGAALGDEEAQMNIEDDVDLAITEMMEEFR